MNYRSIECSPTSNASSPTKSCIDPSLHFTSRVFVSRIGRPSSPISNRPRLSRLCRHLMILVVNLNSSASCRNERHGKLQQGRFLSLLNTDHLCGSEEFESSAFLLKRETPKTMQYVCFSASVDSGNLRTTMIKRSRLLLKSTAQAVRYISHSEANGLRDLDSKLNGQSRPLPTDAALPSATIRTNLTRRTTRKETTPAARTVEAGKVTEMCGHQDLQLRCATYAYFREQTRIERVTRTGPRR